MGNRPQVDSIKMEYAAIADMQVSRVALGTWAIGGWMWGGSEEQESIDTIHAALDQGINLIDTAPVYGFGRAEEIVGAALAAPGMRERALIATKAGLQWRDSKVFRNASRARIMGEVEESLVALSMLTDDAPVLVALRAAVPPAAWAEASREAVLTPGGRTYLPEAYAKILDAALA